MNTEYSASTCPIRRRHTKAAVPQGSEIRSNFNCLDGSLDLRNQSASLVKAKERVGLLKPAYSATTANG